METRKQKLEREKLGRDKIRAERSRRVAQREKDRLQKIEEEEQKRIRDEDEIMETPEWKKQRTGRESLEFKKLHKEAMELDDKDFSVEKILKLMSFKSGVVETFISLIKCYPEKPHYIMDEGKRWNKEQRAKTGRHLHLLLDWGLARKVLYCNLTLKKSEIKKSERENVSKISKEDRKIIKKKFKDWTKKGSPKEQMTWAAWTFYWTLTEKGKDINLGKGVIELFRKGRRTKEEFGSSEGVVIRDRNVIDEKI